MDEEPGILLTPDAHAQVSKAVRWVQRNREMAYREPRPRVQPGGSMYARVTGDPVPWPAGGGYAYTCYDGAVPLDYVVYPGEMVWEDTSEPCTEARYVVLEDVWVYEVNQRKLSRDPDRNRYFGQVLDEFDGTPVVFVDTGGGSDSPFGGGVGTENWAVLIQSPDGSDTITTFNGEAVPDVPVEPFADPGTCTDPGWAWAQAYFDVNSCQWKVVPGGAVGGHFYNTIRQPNGFVPRAGDVVKYSGAPINPADLTTLNFLVRGPAHLRPLTAADFGYVMEWALGSAEVTCSDALSPCGTRDTGFGTPAKCIFTCDGIVNGCWAARIGGKRFPIIINDDGVVIVG